MRLLPLLLALLALLAQPLRAATDIVEVTSPGGITAWLVQEPSIPMLAIEAHFQGGAVLDPDDKLGAANLMMALLEEGAGTYDAQGFAARAEELALRYGFSGGRDGVTVSAQMLTEFRAESVPLLALAVGEPRFDEDAVERVRAQALSGLQSDRTDPNWLAGRAFSQALYPDHPYARPADGTVESVAALTPDDLRAAHRRSFARDRLTVGVVGDITPEALGPMLDRLFGALPATGPALPPVAEIPDTGGLQVIDFDAPQSVARFGHAGIMRRHPDFLAAYVLNQVLGGGGFNSRLNEELRETRGLTYGVSTWLGSGDFGAMYGGALSTANAKMAEALALIRAEWARVAEQGITQDELDAAKRYLTGSYALRFNGNARIAGGLVGLQRADLPITYPDERNALVEALTLDEVNAVARRLLKPEALKVVVVGRPAGLEATQ
ncbi:insulinase family protein [Rhodobacteraceae bacterium 2CG4]|uniref:Insulinase family protein n=1 Tax=Halovulum marinum TaxID=2662447 RepID=A0A6L5Z4H7_9RHOB|nr:pitrilysin family protein [Halovulum marinum]MSU91357.1 insulinase family protein [Halovulum marinum]